MPAGGSSGGGWVPLPLVPTASAALSLLVLIQPMTPFSRPHTPNTQPVRVAGSDPVCQKTTRSATVYATRKTASRTRILSMVPIFFLGGFRSCRSVRRRFRRCLYASRATFQPTRPLRGATQVQASASRTFTEAVSTAWNTLKYRVRAKDSYGNYSAYTTSGDIAVIHNQPPVISGSNADLGIKRADFTYQYSVTDPDGDTVNVVEKIDGKTIATKNAITLGATQTLSVSGNTFTALTNAKHTITITATDSAGNSAVRTLTFTKSIAGFVITLSAPLEADSQPTRANVKVTRDIPAGGTFKVEVTNNPFDASPVWEDCTNAVVQGVAHVFTNKINTAAQYGMNIRVTVQRGDALTACWVSGIGGNFE